MSEVGEGSTRPTQTTPHHMTHSQVAGQKAQAVQGNFDSSL